MTKCVRSAAANSAPVPVVNVTALCGLIFLGTDKVLLRLSDCCCCVCAALLLLLPHFCCWAEYDKSAATSAAETPAGFLIICIGEGGGRKSLVVVILILDGGRGGGGGLSNSALRPDADDFLIVGCCEAAGCEINSGVWSLDLCCNGDGDDGDITLFVALGGAATVGGGGGLGISIHVLC